MLDSDSLLQVFSHYRLQQEENWNLRLMWRRLAHICQRWRYLIYNSPSFLDLCLFLRNDSPSIDTLRHLPPIPLVIDYSSLTRTITQKDGDNIHFGLQQHRRVRRVDLQAPSSHFRMWLLQMNQLYPKLTELSLLSTTTEEMSLVLPDTFQAPDLRHLALHGISLSTRSPSLLSSAITISTLSLTHIGASSYISPGHLVEQLQGLPHLEELSIGFAIPIPLPSSDGDLLPPPIPPVSLPTLRRLTFRGVDIYLDNLVAQINAPVLERLSLTLFFDLTFTLVKLTEFIHRTEGFECLVAKVIFSEDGACIDAGHHKYDQPYFRPYISKLSLNVYCEPLDWQIDSATQVCTALGNIVSVIEELTVDLNVASIQSGWEDTLDSMAWFELLLPFIGVKKLHIGFSLTFELPHALEKIAGGLVLELLPGLQEIEVQLEFDHARILLSTFFETRESVGRPVHLSALPILHEVPGARPRRPPQTRLSPLSHSDLNAMAESTASRDPFSVLTGTDQSQGFPFQWPLTDVSSETIFPSSISIPTSPIDTYVPFNGILEPNSSRLSPPKIAITF